MFRSASRSLLRSPSASSAPRHIRLPQGRRFISTAPPSQKSRSWKSTAVRWGLAIGAVYYYNTSTVFAEEPSLALQQISGQDDEDTSSLPTLETVAEAKKRRIASAESKKQAAQQQQQQQQQQPEQPAQSAQSDAVAAADVEVAPTESQPLELSPEGLEEEAGQEGAFNPETGEINWDCPCLGGMAHGPCGEEFKAAFSCFVYSTEEPKGMDCIEKFKGMQDCFRLHPDIYGNELDDEEEVDRKVDEQVAADKANEAAASPASEDKSASGPVDSAPKPSPVTSAVQQEEEQQDELLVPKVWHDTRDINKEVKDSNTGK